MATKSQPCFLISSFPCVCAQRREDRQSIAPYELTGDRSLDALCITGSCAATTFRICIELRMGPNGFLSSCARMARTRLCDIRVSQRLLGKLPFVNIGRCTAPTQHLAASSLMGTARNKTSGTRHPRLAASETRTQRLFAPYGVVPSAHHRRRSSE